MNYALLALFILAGLVMGNKEAIQNAALTNSDWFTRWDSLIHEKARKYQVPWRWVKAVMWNESTLGLNRRVASGLSTPTDAESSKSADGKSWGLMQVTLITANEMRPGTSVSDLNNPEISVDLGARYLAKQFRTFKGDREKTIRAYNGGPGFEKTVAGQRDTPIYYAKFEKHLAEILSKQPGDEREI